MSGPLSSALTDSEIEMLEMVARSRARRWRVPPEDAVQQAWLVCLQKMRYVLKYRQMGEAGERAFRKMVRHAADEGCAALRGPSGTPVGREPFTADQVRALLRVVWQPEDWPQPHVPVLPSGLRAVFPVDHGRVEDAWAMLHDLAGYLQRLPSVERQLLSLRYGEGLSTAEAAELLGLTIDAADMKIHRVVKRLGALLGRGER